MSALYNLEPQPTAKVLLTTTSGDLELEIFAKQTPLASRNFLQHCIDGYYDNTVFHRLVPGFIIQGGDPTGTGHGGESALERETFEDEFHSRLKYNRRGLLGMANGGGKDENGSQFFLTLAATPELQGRNTMFGRIVGDTIYNLMKMGDAELEPVEGSERPMYPTRVTKTEVLVNPFEDMVKRQVKVTSTGSGAKESKDTKKKAKKKSGKTLLSFQNDDGDEDAQAPLSKKEKFNPKLVRAGVGKEPERLSETTQSGNSQPTKSEKRVERPTRRRLSRSPTPPEVKRADPKLQLPLPDEEEASSRSPSSSPDDRPVEKMTNLLNKTNAQIADLKASMKRNVAAPPPATSHKKSALEQMIPESAMRGRKRKHGAKEAAERETMDMLNAFRTKLEKAAPESNGDAMAHAYGNPPLPDKGDQKEQDAEEEAEVCDLHFIANCQSCQSWDAQSKRDADPAELNDDGWMSHTLSFEKDRLGKDLTWKRKNEEELLVIDPREKAKGLKEEQKARKMARTGGRAGNVTEWDRGREPRKII